MDTVAASAPLQPPPAGNAGPDTRLPQGWSALPRPAPLDMPVHPLEETPDLHGRSHVPPTEWRLIGLRRVLVIGSAVAMTGAAGYEMDLVFNAVQRSVAGMVMLVLFVLLFMWIALAFTSAIAGFCSMLAGGGLGLGIARGGPLPRLLTRTALLMPTYNEDPGRVMAGLRATIDSLAATRQERAFDVFILSDTTDPDVWVAEEAAYMALCRATGWGGRLFYRRRAVNTDRKAGNIAQWVRTYGAAYQQMITLDADSVMSGDVIVRLTSAMERNPGVALIQSLPVIVNGRTLFARMQQFAGRVYGPLIAHGIAWWHGSEGNYWGHNAVIRTAAFAEQAGMPHLPGRKPFGGAIMSHDFVEAALMRRGGWAIHMVPALSGSYEESPPSLTDIAIRDRRWCQGNLQHAKVVSARGLHWVSRMHMLMGIGSYVTAPLWLVFLLVGIVVSLQSRFYKPEYFGDTKLLYPHWPHVDPVQAEYMFIGTMGVLLAPKILAYILLLVDGPLRRGCGGAIAAGASILVETVVGGLLAPIAMLIQTGGVLSILLGRDSGWNAQRRDADGLQVMQNVRLYMIHTVLGLLLAGAAWSVSLPLFVWMLPVTLGLVCAIPLAVLTGSSAVGQAFRRARLLLIPEETDPPPVLAEAVTYMGQMAGHPVQEAIAALRARAGLLRVHEVMLPPPRRPGDPINPALLVGLLKVREAPDLASALRMLNRAEKSAVLGNAEGLQLLARLP
ncbi:glucan biosynthesis glucosyltransferase H [Komagataeibacter rhaeticus]|mgnify:FL=1|uniref:Glucans biosynthesis glucosyltransferase H n=1 Tax=Komagataeibacter rhaeticus TaxID=215221 RepID=A0A181C6Z7_9PROT|nr:glucans biosynthesis glucosyltransferase MdoH [Komagataeibacter rhaeticus]ATU73794.1 glucans biosynthesis glucosyltransferase MdoH [Komagataeibacter xylinus]EGG78354.1 Glucans biosynthesis glucosyltransferase H [Gluconacetobacter sp. SXCC-1]KDU94862.1 glucosyltransferase [Komagataeibacter rhaeticus AF1]MBL7239334.1 glucans biosynthesis glucosyltransferase MdoH [Komagataeibacter rhaeticus]PYD55117.1 glucan biosynthesis glucosyltransferase H [Komagataeibacter rhaeticus]